MTVDRTRVACNPMNLRYRHQSVRPSKGMFREGADPSVVRFRDRFYLFPSMSAGFWHSTDLLEWTYQPNATLPAFDYAPDAREIDGRLVVCASRARGACSFYRSPDPLHVDFEEIPGSLNFWDPNLFQDDDGRVYLYWGCSNRKPLYGVELDRTTFAPMGEQRVLFDLDPDVRGWERPGETYHPVPATGLRRLAGSAPFLEGAWMTKHDDTYYLQYSAPGTELDTYADGYCTSDAPLGPFTASAHNPFSSKLGGFITGAGHGSTFEDAHGNWWHVSTMRISVKHMFERRIGLFPAGFDDDGVLFCNQNFADYPMVVPDRRFDPWTETFPGWMLLSYRRHAQASSALVDHGPELAVDEDIRTWWVPSAEDPAPTLTVDLGAISTVHAVQLNLADHDAKPPTGSLRRSRLTPIGLREIDSSDESTDYVIEGSQDGVSWNRVRDTRGSSEDLPHDFVVLDQPAPFRFVRVIGGRVAHGASFAVSGLRVFGTGDGEPPAPVEPTVQRLGPLDVRLSWTASPSAQGYNVRYGVQPEKLYQNWMVYDRSQLEIGSLHADQRYWFRVDAFNENGITPGGVTSTD